MVTRYVEICLDCTAALSEVDIIYNVAGFSIAWLRVCGPWW